MGEKCSLIIMVQMRQPAGVILTCDIIKDKNFHNVRKEALTCVDPKLAQSLWRAVYQ